MGAGSQLASNTPKNAFMGNLTLSSPLEWLWYSHHVATNKVEIMVNKKGGKLEIVFIDKEGKWYPIDEVDREDLAEGLEKVSKEVAKRLQLLKDQR